MLRLAPGTCLLIVALAGCGGPAPRPADPAAAVETLRAALDAWQGGQPPDALQKQPTAVVAADPDWQRGARLRRYEVLDAEARPSGFDLAYPVRLWLDDNKPRRVTYAVSTSPRRVVVRDGGL